MFKARGPAEALAMIEPLDDQLRNYFYVHGTKGTFLRDLGRTEEARIAFDKAVSLADTRGRLRRLISAPRSKA
jgi:RNA polymerase sigma-70 factor (ECF subfamily)